MLTQEEANILFEMKKTIISNNFNGFFPEWKENVDFKLLSENKKEEFRLIINRVKGTSNKITSVKICRNLYCLRRVDFGHRHQNPLADKLPQIIPSEFNGAKISNPHIHLYVEGFEDTFVLPLNFVFNDENSIKNSYNAVKYFINYCSIKPIPILPKQGKLYE